VRNAIRAKGLPPFLLHVEFDLGALQSVLEGVEKPVLAFAELPRLQHIGQVSRGAFEGFAAEFCILHFFREAGLFGFEHVGEEFVEFYSLREGEAASHEFLNELVAVSGFLGCPTTSAQVIRGGGGWRWGCRLHPILPIQTTPARTRITTPPIIVQLGLLPRSTLLLRPPTSLGR